MKPPGFTCTRAPRPGPDILDTPDRLPLPAHAGYLALAFLIRHQARGGAAQLPAGAVLGRWAPSVLVTGAGAGSPQGTDPRQVLLARLAESASADLPGLVERLIEGHLATRTWPHRLESLDAAFDSKLACSPPPARPAGRTSPWRGRIAQRESAILTRWRQAVRPLLRPRMPSARSPIGQSGGLRIRRLGIRVSPSALEGG